MLAPQPNVVVCSCFFGYCRHLAARQSCLRCSARTGGVSDIKVELVSGVARLGHTGARALATGGEALGRAPLDTGAGTHMNNQR